MVVLPAPLRPTRASFSPLWSVKERSFNAKNFFEINMIKDFDLDQEITQNATTETELFENIAQTIKKLERKMLKEAEALNFEEAARLRDKIQKLKDAEIKF